MPDFKETFNFGLSKLADETHQSSEAFYEAFRTLHDNRLELEQDEPSLRRLLVSIKLGLEALATKGVGLGLEQFSQAAEFGAKKTAVKP